MPRCSYACKPFARAKYSLSLFTVIYSEKMKIDCSKVPVAAMLANLSPEETIDFHFVTLDFYLV